MSLDIAFLGTGSGYPTPFRGSSCIALRRDGEVYLIDCGEGSQTQIMKLKLIRPGKVTKIFITHLHGDHLFGLPGLLCTISMAYKSSNEEADGIEKEQTDPTNTIIEIYGPLGLRRFLRETLSLSRSVLAFQYVVHEVVPENVRFRQGRDWDVKDSNWTLEEKASGPLHINEMKTGHAIFYDPCHNGWLVCKDSNVTILAGQLRHRVPAFGFVFQEPSKPGKLDSQKLIAAGVPRGPLFGKIKNGETVTLENGTVIIPNEYIGPNQPGRKVAVLQDTCDSWGALEICRDCDVIVHEATNENAHQKQCIENGHSTPYMAGEFASVAGASTLILTHFSQRYKDKNLHENLTPDSLTVDRLASEAAEVFSGTVVNAYDGLIFPVTRKVP